MEPDTQLWLMRALFIATAVLAYQIGKIHGRTVQLRECIAAFKAAQAAAKRQEDAE